MLADAAAVQPDRGPRRAKAVVALQVAVVAAVAQRRVVDAAVDVADVGRAGAAAIEEVDGDGQRRVLLHGRARDAAELVVVAVAARVAPRRRRVGPHLQLAAVRARRVDGHQLRLPRRRRRAVQADVVRVAAEVGHAVGHGAVLQVRARRRVARVDVADDDAVVGVVAVVEAVDVLRVRDGEAQAAARRRRRVVVVEREAAHRPRLARRRRREQQADRALGARREAERPRLGHVAEAVDADVLEVAAPSRGAVASASE